MGDLQLGEGLSDITPECHKPKTDRSHSSKMKHVCSASDPVRPATDWGRILANHIADKGFCIYTFGICRGSLTFSSKTNKQRNNSVKSWQRT